MTLRPYQQEAVSAITDGLRTGGKGQLHAACGSGKTIMSIAAADQLVPGPGLLVVLAPSLALVAQTVTEWRTRSRIGEVLAVCSDDTVVDAPAHLDDIDAHVTTDPQEIAAWISGSTGRRLIVGTYRSADRLAEALRENDVQADLLILDEAHHLAGRTDFATRRVLEDAFLPALRRLFMTATPRIDDVRTETSLGMVSMSDTDVFGPVLAEYSWSRAIREGHLDDYRVVIIGVTRAQLWELLRDDRLLVEDGGSVDLRVLAAQTVIAQAARQYDLRRIIAFTSRLESAAEFARSLPSTLRRLPDEARPVGPVHAERIIGEMDQRQRERVMENLRTPPGGPQGWTVITNVRCLSEGVDVPAVDAVAFTHPKASQVDIVQSVGRALRRSPDGHGTATVIVPIVVPDSAEDINDLDPGEYRVLWQVLRALRAHDESLGIELDSQAYHRGVNSPQLPSRVTVQLPPGTSDDVLSGIKALTIKHTTSRWWTGYGHARTYFETRGHLEVPSSAVTEDGFRLGAWIINARQHYRKGWLRSERVSALNQIGMVWDGNAVPWERFQKELRAYREEYGHVLVPQRYVTPSGYALGSKVNTTRTHHERVPSAVKATLNDLGMVWNTRDLAWQQLYEECRWYADEHGHLSVPSTYTAPDGFPLGKRLQRYLRKWEKGAIEDAEHASLRELGWRPEISGRAGKWVQFLHACDQYVAEFGSLRDIRKDYVTPDGYRLGAAIMYYRNLYNGKKSKNGTATLPPERVKALEDRGMAWKSAWGTSHHHRRNITTEEATSLHLLLPHQQGPEIIRLVDEEHVTQASIASALDTHPSHLNVKIKKFRETGAWPYRVKK